MTWVTRCAVKMSGVFLTLVAMCCIATSQNERLMVRTAAWNMLIPTVLKSPKRNADSFCFVGGIKDKKSGGLPCRNPPHLNQPWRDGTEQHITCTARAPERLCELWAEQDLGERLLFHQEDSNEPHRVKQMISVAKTGLSTIWTIASVTSQMYLPPSFLHLKAMYYVYVWLWAFYNIIS